jgi:hypothetical protein
MNDSSIGARRISRILAGVVLALAVLGAHHYLPSQSSALASETIRSLHGTGFGVVAILVFRFGNFTGSAVARYVKSGAATLVLAIVAEGAQIPGPREAELSDLLIDALGIVGFLACSAALDREFRSTVGKLAVTSTLLIGVPMLVAAVAPTIWLSYALVMRSHAIPQLLNFEEPWESTYAHGDEVDYDVITAPPGWPTGSGNVAKLYSAGRYGLMLHLQAYPDWTGYTAVGFVAATSGGETRHIAFGLWGLPPGDGRLPGRYYTLVEIGAAPARHCVFFDDLPGANSDRPFDLRHVSELILGTSKDDLGVSIYVDDFRLESTPTACSNSP